MKSLYYTITSVKNNQSGFTLIEILISLAIGALLLGGIAGFMVSGIQNTRSTAQQLNQERENKNIDSVLNLIQTYGINDLQPVGGSGFLVLSNNKSYLLEEKTLTTTCSVPYNYLEITEVLRNNTGSLQISGHYSIDESGLKILSGSIAIFGTGIQGGRIVEEKPLYTELGGASSLSLSGTTLAISDPINHRVFLLSTIGSTFASIDTLEYGIEYPVAAIHVTNGLEITGNTKAITIIDNPGGTFTGSFSKTITNTTGGNIIITAIQTGFSGASIISSSPTLTVKPICPSGGSDCKNPGDTFSIAGGILTYAFSGTGIIVSDNQSVGVSLNGVNLNYKNGSGKEYFGEIRLLSGSIVQINEKFHYSTLGDGNLLTAAGNQLKQTQTGSYLRKIGSAAGTDFGSGIIELEKTRKIGTKLISNNPISNLSIIPTVDSKGYILSYGNYQSHDCKNSTNLKKNEIFFIKKQTSQVCQNLNQ